MEQVLSFLSSKGFHVPNFEPNGVLHRFGRNGSKDSGWYIAWQNARLNSGEFYFVCSFGDWRTGESHIYKPDKLTRAEDAAINEQIKSRQVAIQKEKEKVQLQTADKAETRFNAAYKEGKTPYMERKLIPELYGSCIYRDCLQVPMRTLDGVMWNMQTINPDGSKFFMKGGRKKECFHVIGDPITEDGTIYAGEGFATCSSIHQATGKTVVVTFDAGNLIEVVGALVKAYPRLTIIICGDDDRFNEENVGRKKAEKAALLSSGTTIYPQFLEGDLKSTDFNDLHCTQGLDQVKEQILGKPAEKQTGFISLGYEESVCFFYHIPSKDIVKANTFTPMQMYRIAPMEYWEARYPTKKGIDFNRAGHDLIQTCNAVGPFDSTRIRGTGVWLDRGRIVINTGHSLIVDKKEFSLNALNSRHIYIQTRNRMPPIHGRAFTAEEGAHINSVCRRFRWKNATDGYLLAGWIFIARVAGALPIRPHVWITGGKGTGKSTLMENLIAPCLGSPKGKMHLIGSSTEAGIRQALRASSLPIIFDEFETTGKASKERTDSVMELLRSAWSSSQGKILKGSSGGSSVEFQLHFAALLSSIRVKLENDADRSRFSVLELGEHGDDPSQWKILNSLLSAITEETGERIFARACSVVQEIIICQQIIAPYLAKAVTQRYGQQVGTLLAGWWMSEHDRVISDPEASNLAKEYVEDIIEETKSEMSDEEECLNMLLTWSIKLSSESGTTAEMSMADAIRHSGWRTHLIRYGIKVFDGRLIIANKHNELQRFYSNSRWDGNWSRSLKRLPGAEFKTTSFGSRGTISRGVSLPISLV